MRDNALLFYSLLTIVMMFATFQMGTTSESEFLSEAVP